MGSLHQVLEAYARLKEDLRPRRLERRAFGLVEGKFAPAVQRAVDTAELHLEGELAHIKKYGFGCSLCIDSMTKNDRATNNAVLCSDRGDLFIQSTATEDQAKNTDWHKRDMRKALEVVGADRVTFIVVDGEKAASNAAQQLSNEPVEQTEQTPSEERAKIYKYPFLLHQRCATHAWSLLIKDLVEEESTRFNWLYSAWDLAKDINNFARLRSKAKRTRTHYVMRKKAQEGKKVRQLKRHADTRFASVFYVLERFLENWDVLSLTFNEIRTQQLPPDDKNKVRTYALLMQHESFKSAVECAVEVLRPIVIALRRTDSKSANLYFVASDFFRAKKECLEAVDKTCEKLARDSGRVASEQMGKAGFDFIKRRLEKAFDLRQDDIVSNNAWVAHALFAPWNYLDDELFQIEELAERMEQEVEKVLVRVYPRNVDSTTDGKRSAALLEYADFKAQLPAARNEGFFKDSTAQRVFAEQSLREHDRYWSRYKSKVPALAEVAIRFAHGVAGQGSAERINKAVARVFTKVRNRQDHAMTEAFIKIRYDVTRRRMSSQVQKSEGTVEEDEAQDEMKTKTTIR